MLALSKPSFRWVSLSASLLAALALGAWACGSSEPKLNNLTASTATGDLTSSTFAANTGVGSGGASASHAASAGTTGSGGSGGAGGSGVISLKTDKLDPKEVYLAGTLQEGSCDQDAIAHWSDPNTAVTGFDCNFDVRTAQVRPSDGKLLYVNTFEYEVRELHCDECPFMGTYPQNPKANDTILPTPPCDPTGSFLTKFLVDPMGGRVHTCTLSGGTWYDAMGAIVFNDGGDPLIHLGYGTLALTATSVVELQGGGATKFVGLVAPEIFAARAVKPDKFWVVIQSPSSAAPDAQELWEIDAKANATVLGKFPKIPKTAKDVQPFSSALDASGALYQFASGPMTFEDIIVRRTIQGASDVVYDEATKPLVKIHTSGLVTGP